uniref:Raftlin-like n=2 Tax=Scleropages formosus TaxID=113540 RepID=A0A8C9WTS7_SCLFO
MEASLSLQRYYTVKVPLQVQLRDGAVGGISANWLDHMSQHFSNGASLIDAYFHLGNDRDIRARLVESVFVFQEGDSAKPTAYDAIVVEQWTTISNVEVKTDYIPLLHSLAVYGWRLTCVLATPIIKSNGDGSLATKQVVFLQRPALARKKESKKLSLRARSKSNKNSVKDTMKSKNNRSSFSPVAEKETEEQKRIQNEELETEKEEREKLMRKYNRQNERLSTGKDIREEEGKGRVRTEMDDEGEGNCVSETEMGTEEEKKGKTEEVEVVTLKLEQSMQEGQEGAVIHEVHEQGGPSPDRPVDESSGVRIGDNERGEANEEGPTNEGCMGRIYKNVCELNSSEESQPLQRATDCPPSPSC